MAELMKIYLIGYRCTGKTTIGQKLAVFLNMDFFDTDEIIQHQSNMSISQIVEAHGWDNFRDIEKKTLKDTIQINSGVISTGGGIVLDEQNRKLMKTNGICVWLTADANIIVDRLEKDDNTINSRPPLSDLGLIQETKHVLKKRTPLYQVTQHLTIDTGVCSLDESVRIIDRSLKDVRI